MVGRAHPTFSLYRGARAHPLLTLNFELFEVGNSP
jgi:hypothetical protein